MTYKAQPTDVVDWEKLNEWSDQIGSLLKKVKVITPLEFGAIGDGVANDTAALQSMFDYIFNNLRSSLVIKVENIQSVLGLVVDLGGKNYRITTDVFPKSYADLTIRDGTITYDGAVEGYCLNFTGNFQENITMSRVNFEGKHKGNGVYLQSFIRAKIFDCYFHGFKTYGVYVAAGNHEAEILDSYFAEYVWNETGWETQTGTAIRMANNDNYVRGNVILCCKKGIVVDYQGHIITENHIYSGGITVDNNTVGISLEAGAGFNLIHDNYIDSANIHVKGLANTNSIDNNMFLYAGTDTTFNFIRIIPQTAGTWVRGLSIQGNIFKSSACTIDMLGVDTANGTIARCYDTHIKDNKTTAISASNYRVKLKTTHPIRATAWTTGIKQMVIDFSDVVPFSDIQKAVVTMESAKSVSAHIDAKLGKTLTVSHSQYSRQYGDGTTTDFRLPFLYTKQSEVVVQLGGVATTAFTWSSDTMIRFTTAPTNNQTIEIYVPINGAVHVMADFNYVD